MIHYSAWLARRWHDPAFPQAFPWFAEPRYWEQHYRSLEDQLAAVARAAARVVIGTARAVVESGIFGNHMRMAGEKMMTSAKVLLLCAMLAAGACHRDSGAAPAAEPPRRASAE